MCRFTVFGAGVGGNTHHRHGRESAGSVRGNEYKRQLRSRNGDAKREFRQKKKDERDNAVSASVAVFHYFEDALFGVSAAETVEKIGNAVFVQRAGCSHHSDDGGYNRNGLRKREHKQHKNSRADAAYNGAHQRKITRRLREIILGIIDFSYRNAAVKLHRVKKEIELLFHRADCNSIVIRLLFSRFVETFIATTNNTK